MNKVKSSWQNLRRRRSWPLSRHSPRILLEKQRKTTKMLQFGNLAELRNGLLQNANTLSTVILRLARKVGLHSRLNLFPSLPP